MNFDNPDNWFNGTAKKTKKSAGGGGGITIQGNRSPSNVKATTLKSVNAINQKLPQVMVKISGSSKGTDKAQAHTNYIGRNGDVEIENEEGKKFKGKDNQKDLLKSWEAMGLHTNDKTGTRKEAFHIVFSMPKGTNPESLKTAVKNLVQEEFSGHKYFMAQHLDTDSPHVHVLLSATDDRGARLNPRKADLHNYRVQFVHKLAEQGIEATASRRLHRFKYQEGKKQGQIHKEKREGVTTVKTKPTERNRRNIENTHKEIKDIYKNYSDGLPDSNFQLRSEITKLLKAQDQDKNKGR